ncbi:tRNA lysidine(34) synthetase TilS [Proteiniborus sp. MB09-C3]|uniref:tRNA lysidine(34) synthetase TilS n=1 Tax=Proteiniborus sp. MB09-C3 TaxID=3050072 RepID=UPI0025564C4D|nr:tRNA lysidine(34) synthetase TilS [Proteiniborus sp. MB09-C3]WIV13054.1 tRNA lysidine(34) synthetase TilS [Proteiniborus sp. MB09-C3]
MKEKVVNSIKEYSLIAKNDRIVIGVSGGPDSMALLYILKDLKDELGFNIYVAHINHGIRNEEADADEEFVRNICLKFSLPFYSTKVNMDEYARENKITSEEAGRAIRYGFFNKILDGIGGGKIAVAHNKNDQAETLLMRFFRGTGLEGLRGMEHKNMNIIRPLLDISREEIEKYCRDNNIAVRIDRTNLEPIYGRNRTRLEVIPYIVKHYNKNIIDTLNRTSKLMQMDSEFILGIVEEKYKNIVVDESPNSIVLYIDKLKNEHYSIKSRVIRKSIEKINGSLKGIEEKHINNIISLIEENITGKSINITNNIVIKTSYGNMIIKKDNKNNIDFFKYFLPVGETIHIYELGSDITSKVVSISEVDIKQINRFIKYFDYDKIRGKLYIRNRKDGDRFTPLGMEGSKKLKDFFIDEKVPRDERNLIPIIEDNKGIIWVVGYRISEEYKVSCHTSKVLILEYKKH